MAKDRHKPLQRLVVVAHKPYRRFLWSGAITLLVCMLGGAGFFIGFTGGIKNSLSLADRLGKAENELELRAKKIADLEQQLAIAHMGSRVDREASDQIRERLVERQAQNAELREEINLYQGVISPDSSRRGLDIPSLRLYATSTDGRSFKLVLVLQQLSAGKTTVDALVEIKITGVLGGKEQTLPLEQLLDEGQDSGNRYQFLYYVTVERELTLPKGFKPLRVDVTAKTSGGSPQQADSSFDWVL